MRIVDVDHTGPLLDAVHRDVLTPSFPPDELEDLEWLRDGTADGTVLTLAAVDDSGAPVGAAVGEWSAFSRVLLLSYLAVRSGTRAQGVGGQLVEGVTGIWHKRLDPALTLAEAEHPAAHPPSASYGDPTARLRFYARHGATALDVPHFQPRLRPETRPVYGLVLLVLTMAPEHAGARPGTVSPDPVRAFLDGYVLTHPDPAPADPPTQAVLRALDRPNGIPLLPLHDPAALPCSTPD